MKNDPRSTEFSIVDGAAMPRPVPGQSARDLPRLLTCREAGDYTGLGERYMRRLIDEERITFVRIGALVRFEREVLEEFIARHRVPPRQGPPVAR